MSNNNLNCGLTYREDFILASLEAITTSPDLMLKACKHVLNARITRKSAEKICAEAMRRDRAQHGYKD